MAVLLPAGRQDHHPAGWPLLQLFVMLHQPSGLLARCSREQLHKDVLDNHLGDDVAVVAGLVRCTTGERVAGLAAQMAQLRAEKAQVAARGASLSRRPLPPELRCTRVARRRRESRRSR